MQCSTPQDRTVGVIWTSAGQLFVHPQLVINPDWGFIFNCTRPKYQIITACLICSRIRRHDCVLLIIQPSHKIFHHPEYANSTDVTTGIAHWSTHHWTLPVAVKPSGLALSITCRMQQSIPPFKSRQEQTLSAQGFDLATFRLLVQRFNH